MAIYFNKTSVVPPSKYFFIDIQLISMTINDGYFLRLRPFLSHLVLFLTQPKKIAFAPMLRDVETRGTKHTPAAAQQHSSLFYIFF